MSSFALSVSSSKPAVVFDSTSLAFRSVMDSFCGRLPSSLPRICTLSTFMCMWLPSSFFVLSNLFRLWGNDFTSHSTYVLCRLSSFRSSDRGVLFFFSSLSLSFFSLRDSSFMMSSAN